MTKPAECISSKTNHYDSLPFGLSTQSLSSEKVEIVYLAPANRLACTSPSAFVPLNTVTAPTTAMTGKT